MGMAEGIEGKETVKKETVDKLLYELFWTVGKIMKKQLILITLLTLLEVIFLAKRAMCVEFHITAQDGTIHDCAFLYLKKSSAICSRSDHTVKKKKKNNVKEITVFQKGKNYTMNLETTDYDKLCSIVNLLNDEKQQTVYKNTRQNMENSHHESSTSEDSRFSNCLDSCAKSGIDCINKSVAQKKLNNVNNCNLTQEYCYQGCARNYQMATSD